MFLPRLDIFCDLLLDRCTATWNLFVLYNNEVKALFISKSFNLSHITQKPAFAGPLPTLGNAKKPFDVIYCLYKMKLLVTMHVLVDLLVAMHSKEF